MKLYKISYDISYTNINRKTRKADHESYLNIKYTHTDPNKIESSFLHTIIKQGYVSLTPLNSHRIEIIDIDNHMIKTFTHEVITQHIIQETRDNTINNIIDESI